MDAPAPRSCLTLQHVTQVYPRFTLGPLDVTFSPGVTGLVGANGAGKSTLLRLLVGAELPRSGRIDRPRESRTIGYVPQDFAAPPRQRVSGVLAFAAWAHGLSAPERSRAVAHVVDQLDLGSLLATPYGRLSGGQQRRVALAQALVHDPRVLVLDEPTAGLDPLQRVQVRELVRDTAQDRTVVLSSHLGEDIEPLAHQVVVLVDGSMAFCGLPQDLRERARPGVPGDSDFERGIVSLLSPVGGAQR